MAAGPRVGVLALQGGVAAHTRALAGLGAVPVEVRAPAGLEGLDGLIIPGGESTTLSNLARSGGLVEPLAERIGAGLPTFGTCAGMILLAHAVLDGREDQVWLDAIDIDVRRNAFGRQLASFEVDLAVTGLGDAFAAVFIRAPVVTRVGAEVEVLARLPADHGGDGDPAGSGGSDTEMPPVLVRSGPVFVSSFHPELTDDRRLHARFLEEV